MEDFWGFVTYAEKLQFLGIVSWNGPEIHGVMEGFRKITITITITRYWQVRSTR